MEFTREELWALQSRAEKGHAAVLNENWKRAYEDLIHAISVLDAFVARSSVSADVPTISAYDSLAAAQTTLDEAKAH